MKLSAYLMIFLLTGLTITFLSPAFSWGNGGLTTDLNNPKYGSHDWFAQHALDFLPDEEKSYLQDNLNDYLIGTEMPDNSGLIGGLNDKTFHHVYYNDDRSLQDDVGATRTQSEFLRTIHYLNFNEGKLAARSAGVMTHYIADLSVFAHTMAAVTVWGAETHHSDFENYVGTRTTSYDSVFNSVLVFDGSLDMITGYDAAIQMGLTSTFGDGSKIQSNVWMDTNYDWSSQTFEDSATTNMNNAVNLLADMLHTIYVTANVGSGITPDHILISEVYYDTSGTDSVEEYVELYNPLSNTVDISNWKLADNSGSFTIPEGSIIGSNTYFTISKDANKFQTDYGKAPDLGGLSIGFTNTGEKVSLLDQNGVEVDFVAWEKFVAGWDIVANTGKTIQRIPVNADSDTNADWSSNQPQDPVTQPDVVAPPPEPEPEPEPTPDPTPEPTPEPTPTPTTSSPILITEVYYDTVGTDSKEEFIELFNPTSTDVDISGWTLSDDRGTYTFPSGTVIQANSSLTVARDATGFQDLFGSPPDISGLTLSLSNSGDQVSLKDGNGVDVDFVAYENSVAGWDIAASTGQSIQRIGTEDTDSVSDWTVNDPNPGTPLWVWLAIAAAAAAVGGGATYVKRKGKGGGGGGGGKKK